MSDTTYKKTQRAYILGFSLSIALTLAAYILVVGHHFSHYAILLTIIFLALVQFLVQLQFFLHIGRESKPRWNLLVLLFMVIIVWILVFGSLWIMTNLNYHHDHMTPDQTDQFIIHDENVQE